MTKIYTFARLGEARIADSAKEAAENLSHIHGYNISPKSAKLSKEPGDEEFEAAYGEPVQHENTITGNPETLETFGAELELVQNTDPKHVWTIVDGDDGISRLIPGFHFVNAINYLITKIPWKSEEECYVWA